MERYFVNYTDKIIGVSELWSVGRSVGQSLSIVYFEAYHGRQQLCANALCSQQTIVKNREFLPYGKTVRFRQNQQLTACIRLNESLQILHLS